MQDKTCVINDPFGQTHSPASSDHYFSLQSFFCDIWKVGTDVRTETCAKIMITTGPGLWVGRVDQKNQQEMTPFFLFTRQMNFVACIFCICFYFNETESEYIWTHTAEVCPFST